MSFAALLHPVVKRVTTRQAFARWCVWRSEREATAKSAEVLAAAGMLKQALAEVHDCKPPHRETYIGADDRWWIELSAPIQAGDEWRCECGALWRAKKFGLLSWCRVLKRANPSHAVRH